MLHDFVQRNEQCVLGRELPASQKLPSAIVSGMGDEKNRLPLTENLTSCNRCNILWLVEDPICLF